MVSPDISLGICTHKVEKISAGHHPILRRPRKSKEGKWILSFLVLRVSSEALANKTSCSLVTGTPGLPVLTVWVFRLSASDQQLTLFTVLTW